MKNYDLLYEGFLKNFSYPRLLKSYQRDPSSTQMSVSRQGRRLIDFSSNDYLGLAKHPSLIQRSQSFAKEWGTGLSSSRLVSGNHIVYDEIERRLAKALGKEGVLIFPSGYQANITVLEALLDPSILGRSTAVFCDRYCHASLQMGAKLSRLYRFRHNDLEHLERLLNKNSTIENKFILVESLYSMDGDQANLSALTMLAQKYDAFLYVDDAHAVGGCGIDGWGMASAYANDIPLIMGTFSKALGSSGSYVACSSLLRDYLINKCKGIIYSTALPPPVLGAISAAIELVPMLHECREYLANQANNLRNFFKINNLNCGNSKSYIIPWIIGDAKKTREISQFLEENAILAVAIQPPTVPIGTSRIRFCLSANHQENEINYLQTVLQQVIKVHFPELN